MKVIASVSVEIDKQTVEQIFQQELHKLTEDANGEEIWIVEKSVPGIKKGIYITYDMQGRGSDVNGLISDDVNDPKYRIQVAARRLISYLQERRK